MEKFERPNIEENITPGTTGIALAIEEAEKNIDLILTFGSGTGGTICCQNQF